MNFVSLKSAVAVTLPSLFVCGCAESSPELKGSRPNIILIYADDWGFGDLSAHGHQGLKTPNLDRMISEGTDFHQFNVCSPVSSSSRTAIMTGNFPSRHGMHEHIADPELNAQRGMPDFVDPNLTMLPRLLKESGYKTAHYGKWHLSNTFVKNAPLPIVYGYDDTRVFNGDGPQVDNIYQGYKGAGLTESCVTYTMDFIKENMDSPFFVNLWIHESHQPIDPTPEQRLPYADIPEPQQSYYSVITYADKQLGRLFDFLKENGLDENTLIVFSSDNGPEHNFAPSLWNSVGETGGLRGRKRSIYEGGIKTPFIVRMPGTVPAGKVNTSTLLAGVDLLPTFCSIAGVELPAGYAPDGEDITDAFLGREFAKEKPILQFWQGSDAGDNWPRLSAKDNKWKLVTNYDGSQVELYDYLNDWAEENNVADQYPAEVERLSKLAFEYFDSLDLPHIKNKL